MDQIGKDIHTEFGENQGIQWLLNQPRHDLQAGQHVQPTFAYTIPGRYPPLLVGQKAPS